MSYAIKVWRGIKIKKAMTLLRYPGGKTRAIKYLKHYIPNNTEEIVSPFFGGGAFEIYLLNQGVKVYGYDVFNPLVCFWNAVQTNPAELVKKVREHYPLSKNRFYQIQQDILEEKDSLNIAAMFFVLNRSSYSGLTLSGGMSPNHPRFTNNSIEKILKFYSDKLTVEQADFENSISLHKNKLLYCDPPYYIESNNLYGIKGKGHQEFEHKRLRKVLGKHDKWILSYNNHEYIRELYKDYEQVQLDWSYGTSRNSNEKPKELLIINL